MREKPASRKQPSLFWRRIAVLWKG